MKFSLFLRHLGAVSLVASANASEWQDAGARDPTFTNSLPQLSEKGISLLQISLFQHNLELDFLTQGIQNFSLPGYSDAPNQTVKTLEDIKAIVQYQTTITREALRNASAQLVQPCTYQYPGVTKFSDFITVARIWINARIDFTLYLAGALLQSDPALSTVPGASNPILARWDAFFRQLNGFEPFEAPFQTPINPQFAYHIASYFIVPGSCPSSPPNVSPLASISIPFPSLSLPADFVEPLELPWVWNPSDIPQAVPGAQLFVGFHNQLSKPEFVPLNISSPGQGSSQRPTDLWGQAYAVFTNVTTAIDVDTLAATALTGPWVIGGPYR